MSLKRRIGKLMLLTLSFLFMITSVGCSDTGGSIEDSIEDENSGVNEANEVVESDDTRTTTDMAGREHIIPYEIDSVYSSSPVGTNFMYTFDDKLIAGVNYDLSEENTTFVTEHYKTLPNLGGWYGKVMKVT
ncbi:MAG: hypothetical protein ACK5LV_11665 [Lachnospirales bacterium]